MTYSLWNDSDFLGTMKLNGEIVVPANLYALVISFCPTSKARLGRSVIPRSKPNISKTLLRPPFPIKRELDIRGSDDLYSVKKCNESFSYS